MSRFWSPVVRGLSPYVPGEQPKLDNLIKLNTNENPYPPSPHVPAAIAAATDRLRLYPDPRASALREAIATYYKVAPEEVFVGNGSDEVLAHTFLGLLKHDAPLLFPDITYSFYPVYCGLYGISYEEVPLDAAMRVQTRRLPAAMRRHHPAQSERADRHRTAARRDRSAGDRASGPTCGARRGLCRFRR